MVVDHFQYRLRRQKAQITVFFVRVNDLEHPEDSARINHFFLVWCVVLYVKVDYVKKLIEDSPVFGVEKRLENVHEEFLVQFIELELTFIQLIIEHVYWEKALFFIGQLLVDHVVVINSFLILAMGTNRTSGLFTGLMRTSTSLIKYRRAWCLLLSVRLVQY